MIIYATDKAKIKWPKDSAHDPDSEVEYAISYGLPERQDATAYTKGVDVVRPSTANGCIYECVSGGISGTGTSMQTKEGSTFEDGDVTWKCLPATTRLQAGDQITASTWVADSVDVTITDASIVNAIATKCKVTSVPAGASSFELTNTVDITYATGRTEKRQKTLVITIKEL